MLNRISKLLQHPSSWPSGHGITLGTARFYDLSAPLLFGGTRRRSYGQLLMASGAQSGDRVLDVGCGPGYFARMLAQTVGPNGSVVGIDAAPEMIEYASRKARFLPNCRFQSGAAESLAFPDASYDIVVSSLMLHHIPDELRLTAVSEMQRVLRPGGTVLLADFTIPKRGGWHLIASIAGHDAMKRQLSRPERLLAEAGFTDLRSGDAPPWLHYARATKP